MPIIIIVLTNRLTYVHLISIIVYSIGSVSCIDSSSLEAEDLPSLCLAVIPLYFSLRLFIRGFASRQEVC